MSGWASTTFLPPLKSAGALGVNSQPPSTFFTFTGRGRIWVAHLSFTLTSNSSFAANNSTFRAYARILTGSGVVFGGPVELSVSGNNQHAEGNAPAKIDGMLVAANDTLMLDVNNGNPVPSGGGVMSASCTVLYSLP